MSVAHMVEPNKNIPKAKNLLMCSMAVIIGTKLLTPGTNLPSTSQPLLYLAKRLTREYTLA